MAIVETSAPRSLYLMAYSMMLDVGSPIKLMHNGDRIDGIDITVQVKDGIVKSIEYHRVPQAIEA